MSPLPTLEFLLGAAAAGEDRFLVSRSTIAPSIATDMTVIASATLSLSWRLAMRSI